ncbi:hypothetical protein H6F43_13790 [Leptolyngbya sp. FACHB-36]|uniref:hypothetical protein n=1 Tax=Leptolyngbya sp. FACHB-36 TaxID=2692808 RepID=UPI00168038C9|nr:hypothetical protein [Leptolyngbya sp. FACHB-36]MBD2021249.1 hypothetical protein [Leptolyngbya sp. FACHB-36]
MANETRIRALMMRHHHMIRNREQCMLSRAAAELGMPAEVANYSSEIKGEPNPSFRDVYDRSHVGLS